MSTHNICFCGEIRKILCGYPLLSVAMCHKIILYYSMDQFSRRQFDGIFLILPRKQALTFHANCLLFFQVIRL